MIKHSIRPTTPNKRIESDMGQPRGRGCHLRLMRGVETVEKVSVRAVVTWRRCGRLVFYWVFAPRRWTNAAVNALRLFAITPDCRFAR